MSLLELQRAIRAEVAAADDAAPASSPGMEIYRNAYRSRLLDALTQNFEHTRSWVGADAFAAAACHYVLASPPSDWSLDMFGAEFPGLLAQLFPGDPEVAELAWLEWQLQQAFAAPDRPELEPAALAAAGLAEADWAGLHFTMAAGYAARAVRHNCTALWQGPRGGAAAAPTAIDPAMLIVWRKGPSAQYRLMPMDEYAVLHSLANGSALGEASALAGDDSEAPARLGQWLAQWLSEGVFSGFALP